MNTEEDWKREKAEARPRCACQGRGWLTDPNAPSGGIPCGCDETDEDAED